MKFQRTRGVLRLMAAVIHSLWEKGDRNPLILPANISIDDPRVQFELTRYLSDNWVPVIEKDVDGPNSLPLALDGEVPNLGKFAACRRVARTIYLGSAPTADRRPPGHRGPAREARLRHAGRIAGRLRRCPAPAGRRRDLSLPGRRRATGIRPSRPSPSWPKTAPSSSSATPTRWCRNWSSACASRPAQRMGDFSRIHPMPQVRRRCARRSGRAAGRARHRPSLQQGAGNAAELAAKAILESRGNTPRLYRNTLVFLAADKTRLQDLDEAVRHYLAWESILAETGRSSISPPHQVTQAENQKTAADGAVTARLPETYQWLLVPVQATPQAPVTWQALRLSGTDALAVRASKKLRSDELLITSFAATALKMELDRVPLWRGDHVAIKQLVEDFARYLYLPRLSDPRCCCTPSATASA